MNPSRRNILLGLLAGGTAVGLPGRSSSAAHRDAVQQKVEQAISRALQYLSSQQTSNGAWKTEAWGESTAITSLGILAFLAAGHVPGEGAYGEQLQQGIRWVLSQQQSNGMLIRKTQSHGPMFDHGICTLMLAQVCGMLPGSDAVPVRLGLEQAIRLILSSQSVEKFDRHQGGWRYQIDSRDSDLSVTAWQILALRAAKDIGCDIPVEAMERAADYVRACSDRVQKGFAYQPGNGPTPTLTGCGITSLELCGEHHSDESLAGVDWLRAHPLRESSAYFYFGAYYTALGLFKIGGDAATKNYEHLTSLLLPIQQADGSWTPQNESEKQAGRIYSTSFAVLALAVEFCYLPIFQR